MFILEKGREKKMHEMKMTANLISEEGTTFRLAISTIRHWKR